MPSRDLPRLQCRMMVSHNALFVVQSQHTAHQTKVGHSGRRLTLLMAMDEQTFAQQAPVSAIDQCIRCSSPFVGSTPRPYCGNTTGMPPLQRSKVSGVRLCIALQALLCGHTMSN